MTGRDKHRAAADVGFHGVRYRLFLVNNRPRFVGRHSRQVGPTAQKGLPDADRRNAGSHPQMRGDTCVAVVQNAIAVDKHNFGHAIVVAHLAQQVEQDRQLAKREKPGDVGEPHGAAHRVRPNEVSRWHMDQRERGNSLVFPSPRAGNIGDIDAACKLGERGRR